MGKRVSQVHFWQSTPLIFIFTGSQQHAAAAPEEGVNALDAVIQLFNGINALRQQLPAEVKIHGIITNGGEAPNIIPEYASMGLH